MALQVRDCGSSLIPKTVAFDEILKVIEPDPSEATTVEVDAVLSGFNVTYDPDEPMWQTGNDWMGFANADVDRLLTEGRSSTDLAGTSADLQAVADSARRRASVHLRLHPDQRVIVSRAIVSTDADLDLTAPRWWWRPRAAGPRPMSCDPRDLSQNGPTVRHQSKSDRSSDPLRIAIATMGSSKS